jgi:crotonobetainyl-CoA:carnitine CoA-transferase CaiB-like acyl-CoA transferase
VLVEGFRPGVMDRLGVGYAHVAPRAPQLVYCSISAFGQTGRYRDKPAHDMAVEALAGVLSFNLGTDGRPANPGIPAGDMGASLMALSGILMALLTQRRTGRGDYLDVSLYDSLIAWTPNVQGPVFAEHRAHVVKHERNWGGAAFYNVYDTKDGRYIALGGVEHKFAENFLNKAGCPDLIPLCHQPPGPAQDPVKDYLREFFRSKTWMNGPPGSRVWTCAGRRCARFMRRCSIRPPPSAGCCWWTSRAWSISGCRSGSRASRPAPTCGCRSSASTRPRS